MVNYAANTVDGENKSQRNATDQLELLWFYPGRITGSDGDYRHFAQHRGAKIF